MKENSDQLWNKRKIKETTSVWGRRVTYDLGKENKRRVEVVSSSSSKVKRARVNCPSRMTGHYEIILFSYAVSQQK